MNNKDRIQILLKEYEMLHEDSNALGARFWTFAGIILGFNTALLGGVGYFVITSSHKIIYGAQKPIIDIGIVALGVCMVLMLFFLKRWLVHTNKVQKFNYRRACEIEERLGMRKNLRFLGAKSFNPETNDFDIRTPDGFEVGNHTKKLLHKYYDTTNWMRIKNYYSVPQGQRSVKPIVRILMSLWSLLALFALVSLFL
jgi:hypothetical protein